MKYKIINNRHSKSACCTFQQKNYGLILIVCLLIFSCKQDPLKGFITEDDGFMYKHHIQNEGRKAIVSDRVDYHLYFRKVDSILASSHDQGMPITKCRYRRATRVAIWFS